MGKVDNFTKFLMIALVCFFCKCSFDFGDSIYRVETRNNQYNSDTLRFIYEVTYVATSGQNCTMQFEEKTGSVFVRQHTINAIPNGIASIVFFPTGQVLVHNVGYLKGYVAKKK